MTATIISDDVLPTFPQPHVVQKNATAPICGMRVSPSGRRLVLIHRDAPLQIWDLPSKSPLATHFVALPGGAEIVPRRFVLDQLRRRTGVRAG